MPLTRSQEISRRQDIIVQLFLELPGVDYDSDSSRASSPTPDMTHHRQPSTASTQGFTPPGTDDNPNSPQMPAPAGPSGVASLPADVAASSAPAMTMQQMAYLFQTMMANAQPAAPPVAPAPAVTTVIRDRQRSGVRSHRVLMLDSASRSLPTLKEGAYMNWSHAVQDTLTSVGLWNYVTGKAVCPGDKSTREYDLYEMEAASVRAAIVGALDRETSFRYLQGVVDPKDVWDLVKRHYCSSDRATLLSIETQLTSLSLPEGGDAIAHVATLRRLRRELDGTKWEVNPERACSLLNRSLPASYNYWVTNNETAGIDNFDELCMSLENHYRSVLSRFSSPASVGAHPASAFTPRSSQSDSLYVLPPDLARCRITGAKNPSLADRAKATCRDCLLTGHHSNTPQCPQFQIRIELWGPKQQNGNGNRRRGGNPAGSSSGSATSSNAATTANAATTSQSVEYVDANAASVPRSAFPSFSAFPAVLETRVSGSVLACAAASMDSFLIDSGCQVHMTCIRSIFTHLEEVFPPIIIKGIGDAGVVASARGTIALPVEIDGVLSWFYLSGVLYAPELRRNLISSGALMEAGMHLQLGLAGATVFSDSSCSLPLARAVFRDRLWMLETRADILSVQTAVAANVATTGVSWHKRLGHVGVAVLKQLSTSGSIGKLSKSDIDEIANCRVCVLGKGARLPFAASVSTSSSAPLELIHSDLCGPHDPTVGGARYTACFIDDYTRMAWVFLLKTKDELTRTFIRLRAHLELFTPHRIKTLRTDGGGEYLSHVLADHLADAGILHQTSCPNSSQQNGVAERFQRTLYDRVRCMLSEADMSWGWWGEAALTATYLYNRTPHSFLSANATPLSFWTNAPVSLAHIRVFGTTCFAIDTSKHRKKSSARATECRLLGYDAPSKAYRLQEKGSVRVIRSRDVIFHEDRLDASTETSLPAPAVPLEVDASPTESTALDDAVVPDSVGVLDDSVGGSGDSVGGAEEDLPDDIGDEMAPLPLAPPSPRRSKRIRKKTKKAQEMEAVQTNVAEAPKSYREAMSGPESEEWSGALGEEFGSWKEKDVYEVVKRPVDEEIIPSLLLFKRKTDEVGEEVRKKARCVARGDRQSSEPSDSSLLTAPVARAASLRTMAAVAATRDCEFQQMDVKTAFLHAPLSKPVYLSIPCGFPSSELLPGIPRANQALRLKRAVYGLREAPASWYKHCTGILRDNGFVRSDNDHCLFSLPFPGSPDLCHVLIYVDDFTLLTKSVEQMTWLKDLLASLFDLKDLGAANQVLGLEIIRDRTAGTLKITQRKFARQLLEEYNMSDCRPLDTPMFANALTSLPSHTAPLNEQERDFMRDKDYRHLLGCLNWLSLGTRPDLAYALARLGQAQSNPHPEHWRALTHVLRYISNTVDMGLVYSRDAKDAAPCLYTDSSFADCPDTRKSHSGFLVLLGGAAVSWSSRKQAIVTTSSTEAEYVAMGHAAKEAVWIGRLMKDLGVDLGGPMRIYADNQSSMLLADSEKLSSRTKHLDVQYHFVREQVRLGRCRFIWVPTKLNAADVLTKPLGPALFNSMPPLLGMPWVCRDYLAGPNSCGPRTESLHAPSGSVGV